MLAVVVQRYGYWPRVCHRFRRDIAIRVVVLLAVDGIDGCDDQAQPAVFLDLLGNEGEVFEVVAERSSRPDEPWLAQALTISGPEHVPGQRNAAAILTDLIDAHREISIRLVDRDPRREPEEAADFGVLLERSAVIDELLAALRVKHVLIRQAVGIETRLQMRGTQIMRVIDIVVRFAVRAFGSE